MEFAHSYLQSSMQRCISMAVNSNKAAPQKEHLTSVRVKRDVITVCKGNAVLGCTIFYTRPRSFVLHSIS